MTWAEHAKGLQTEVDKFQWAARIHLQCLESAIRSHLSNPTGDLRAQVRKAIEVYLEPDELYGAPPDLFSDSFRKAIFDADVALAPAPIKRKWNVHFKDAEILTVYAVSADSALREAIEHYIDDGSERSTDEYVAEFMRLKSIATVEPE